MGNEPKIYSEPYIIKEAVMFLEGVIKPTDDIFEWGSGSSTIWMAERCALVISVEHDENWASLVKKTAIARRLPVHIHLICPLDPQVYADTILLYDRTWDLIYIDGRARQLCVDNAIELLAPGGFLVFDNTNKIRNQPSVQKINGLGWQVHRFVGDYFLDGEFIGGPGETTIWQRP